MMGEIFQFLFNNMHFNNINSIGSLGKGNSRALVSNVLIDTASLSGTTNGARIKTWQVIST